MRFGSISYLNLLPFQLYLKRILKPSQLNQMLQYKKAVPSKINLAFKQKRVDAAFISSIKSKNANCTNLGIVSKGKVYSVFVLPDKVSYDLDSDTSNILSKVLNISGKVIIGDKALKYYIQNPNASFKDLSHEWQQQTSLPFVFARLCYNRHSKKIKKLAKNFNPKKEKIPQYILKKEATKKGVTVKVIKWYLQFINYEIRYKEKRALVLFFKKAEGY